MSEEVGKQEFNLTYIIRKASDPGTPIAEVEKYAHDLYFAVRATVAESSRLSELADETIVALLGDERVEVPIAAASNPVLPVKYYAVAAAHKSYKVRAAFASNSTQNPEFTIFLKTLLSDENPEVRAAAASNKRVKEIDESYIVSRIEEETSVEVLKNLAANELTEAAYLALKSKGNREVNEILRSNAAVPEELKASIATRKTWLDFLPRKQRA